MEGVYNLRRIFRECPVEDEEKCLKWCQGIRLIPESRTCTKCQRKLTLSKGARDTTTSKRFRCHKCYRDVSLLSGTIFADANMPLGQILTLIYCSVHRFSYEDAMREAQWGDVNLSSATIAHWYETCRDACVSWADRLERSAKMGGTTSVVEVDEAMIGHRKHNTGRLVQGTWVLGIVDVHTSELRVIPCPNNRRDAKTLLTLIDENVLPGTTVMADCWKSCNGLTAKGFQHLTVNHSSHSENRVVKEGAEEAHMSRWGTEKNFG